jgi:hypothetical protein
MTPNSTARVRRRRASRTRKSGTDSAMAADSTDYTHGDEHEAGRRTPFDSP